MENIRFNNKMEYDLAVEEIQKEIAACDKRIELLEADLAIVRAEIKALDKNKTKTTTNKKANEISENKKHEIVTMSDFNTYDYNRRRTEWHRKAGYNKTPVICSKCKEGGHHATVKLESYEHICYCCWIKKPAKKKVLKH